MVNNITHNKFNPRPHLAISGIVTRLLPKITAFVPVPEGSINEKEQAKVAGIINNKGFICPATAIAAKTGKKIFAVAVLLFISVMKIITKITISKTIIVGYSLIKLIFSPRKLANPVWLKESAIAYPPPTIITTPQGTVEAESQSKSLFCLVFLLPDGIANNSKAAIIATVESCT